jgi:hypothetical protein
VSRDRGIRLQNALAAYLRQWWPSAESAGSGRPGSDVLGTPGVVWECKTAREFRPVEWVRQAKSHTLCDCNPKCCAECDGQSYDVPVTVWWPTGVGEGSPQAAMAILPLPELAQLLADAGYAPAREDTR